MTVKPRRRKNNFIDNKEFYNAMTNFRIKCDQAKEKGEPRPQIPRYIWYVWSAQARDAV